MLVFGSWSFVVSVAVAAAEAAVVEGEDAPGGCRQGLTFVWVGYGVPVPVPTTSGS